MMNNKTMKIVWFVHPRDIKNVYWDDLNKPSEETVNFEGNGDKNSNYIWARRKRDNRFMRVGKVMRNYIALPLVFSLAEMLTGLGLIYSYLNTNSNNIMIFCLYSIMLMIFCHYIFNKNTDVMRNEII